MLREVYSCKVRFEEDVIVYSVVKGVPSAYKKPLKDTILIWIPYMNLIIHDPNMKKSRNFWIDVYFIDRVSKIERRAALLKRPEKKITNVEIPKGSLVLEPSVRSSKDVYNMLYETLLHSYETMKTKSFQPRRKKSEWSRLRMFIMPISYRKHFEGEEVDYSAIREAMWAYEILKEALMIQDIKNVKRGYCSGGEIYWYPLLVKSSGNYLIILDGKEKKLKVDTRYTKLLEIDEKARNLLKEECQRLAREHMYDLM